MIYFVDYIGTYEDAFGTVEITIRNNFEKFSLKIDGIEFEGTDFDALEIVDKQLYSDKQVKRFALCQTAIYDTNKFVEEICNCTFTIIIPQLIICQKSREQYVINMNFKYVLGDKKPIALGGGIEFEKIYVSFKIFDKLFESEGNLVEDIFDNIINQFNGEYYLKNCFGCLYSDYSVYGQSALGSMMCFVRQKREYLEVQNKLDYMRNLTDDYDVVQEIFCCNKFEIRRRGTGYRG
jgi:hypothetical protein